MNLHCISLMNQHITGTTRRGQDDGVARGDEFAEICSIIEILVVLVSWEVSQIHSVHT